MMGKGYFIFILLTLIIVPQNYELSAKSEIDPQHKIEVTANSVDFTIEMKYPIIAMVKPVFTATAYSGYYQCFRGETNFQNCFDRPIVDSWSTSSRAIGFIDGLIRDGYPANKIVIINDTTVHDGDIFDDYGKPLYNSLVFFHNEYVTLREYHNTVNFIKAGGNVIILNGNAFFAEVIYDPDKNRVKLVAGHGWAFDGENGTRANTYYSYFMNGIYNKEHDSWLGSRYTTFKLGPTSGAHFRLGTENTHPIALEMQRQNIMIMSDGYNSHEENSMITPNAHIIADWKTSFPQLDRGIKIYELIPEGPYGGSLIHFGFFGTDVLQHNISARKTFVAAIRHQAGYFLDPWIRYPNNNAVLKDQIILDFTKGWKTEVFIDDIQYFGVDQGSNLDFLGEGDHIIKINFQGINQTFSRSVNFSIDRTAPKFLFNGQESFELPSDYPSTSLEIKLVDEHPNFLRVGIGRQIQGIKFAKEDNTLSSVIIDKNFSEGSYIRLEGIDSAGNTVLQWYTFNSSSIEVHPRLIQPHLEKLNDSYLRVGYPSLDENFTATLQISQDFGANWINIPFTESNMTEDVVYAYYKRNSTEILYRIAYKINEITSYVRNIKSYHWDNTVYSIISHNITSQFVENQNFEIKLQKSQVQNVSTYVQWVFENGTLFESTSLGFNISKTQDITTSVPSSQNEHLYLRILVNSSILKWSSEFRSVLEFNGSITQELGSTVVAGETNYFNNSKLLEGTRGVAKITINIETNTSVHESSFDFVHFEGMWFSIRPEQTLTIYYFDMFQNLIKVIYFLKTPDSQIPQIVGLDSIFINASDSKNFEINWNITDNAPDKYEIYLYTVLLERGDFYNNSKVVCTMEELLPGEYNYTLVAIDKSGNIDSHTVIVNVYDDTPIPTPSPTQSTTNTSTPTKTSSTKTTTTTPSIEMSTSSSTEERSKKSESPVFVSTLILFMLLWILRIRKNTP